MRIDPKDFMADHSSKQRSSDDEQAGPGAVSSTAKVDHEQSTGLEDTTLNPGIPRPWHAPMTAVSFRLWRQILGLNPFKGSYFGLYKSLQSPGDRSTVIFGVLLAIAAGVPLPIIVRRDQLLCKNQSLAGWLTDCVLPRRASSLARS